jgi:hypothetical protein
MEGLDVIKLDLSTDVPMQSLVERRAEFINGISSIEVKIRGKTSRLSPDQIPKITNLVFTDILGRRAYQRLVD